MLARGRIKILRKRSRFFCEALCAALNACHCPTPCRLPRSRGPVPEHRLHFSIDASKSETVIRRTLLRYTDKSCKVNQFLAEELWKDGMCLI